MTCASCESVLRGLTLRPLANGECRCCFEGAVSGELLVRLLAVPSMRDALAALPPKMLALSSGRVPEPIVMAAENLDGRVERVVAHELGLLRDLDLRLVDRRQRLVRPVAHLAGRVLRGARALSLCWGGR